jgi:prolyl 4-hydroxylase
MPTFTGNKDDEEECEDSLERCEVWASLGECDKNDDVLKHCRLSCEVCDGGDEEACLDDHEKCAKWADIGECKSNPKWMKEHCAKSCHSCGKYRNKQPKTATEEATAQVKTTPTTDTEDLGTKVSADFGEVQTATGKDREKVLERINSTVAYLASDDVMNMPEKVREGCKNQHALCSFWQLVGECEVNKAYMATNCAPACHSCHLIDFASRCPKLPIDTVPALEPGDLDAMFTRIVDTAPGNQTNVSTNPDMPPYTVTVHSSPDDNGRPWVISFENFLTADEVAALIQHGYEEEYKRSEDVGEEQLDGSFSSTKSSDRTSENAWCSAQKGCRYKEVPQRILDRMSAVVGIPESNSEDLQLLKYEAGQFYHTHHDYIPHQKDRNCGPRILTFFLYLSDVVKGGGTNFPDLGITIQPKTGRALLWPSTLNDKPMEKDKRTKHQALPVEEGVKFGANAWIHMYDYTTPQKDGCN